MLVEVGMTDRLKTLLETEKWWENHIAEIEKHLQETKDYLKIIVKQIEHEQS